MEAMIDKTMLKAARNFTAGLCSTKEEQMNPLNDFALLVKFDIVF